MGIKVATVNLIHDLSADRSAVFNGKMLDGRGIMTIADVHTALSMVPGGSIESSYYLMLGFEIAKGNFRDLLDLIRKRYASASVQLEGIRQAIKACQRIEDLALIEMMIDTEFGKAPCKEAVVVMKELYARHRTLTRKQAGLKARDNSARFQTDAAR